MNAVKTVKDVALEFKVSLSDGRYQFGRYRSDDCPLFRDALLKIPTVYCVTIDATEPSCLYVTVYQDES